MKLLHSLLGVLLFTTFGYAQSIKGVVYIEEAGKKIPLEGAIVYYEVHSAHQTTTDANGRFELSPMKMDMAKVIVVSALGYNSKRIEVTDDRELTVILTTSVLEEVTVTGEAQATNVQAKSATLEFNISKAELRKAACCNLSESFETNPSIDVSFSDAVTGTRQIELFGLSGRYTQIQQEMIPYVRGITSSQGLSHIPGTWIESIQLTKGIGSVVNGYESMIGQINVELVKPEKGPKFAFNTYVNQSGRTELNVLSNYKLNDTWSTGFLLHGSVRPSKLDRNNDGFLDMPTGHQLNFTNRWKYFGKKGWESQFGFRILDDLNQGGQFASNDQTIPTWTSSISNKRIELFAKNGWVDLNSTARSIGIISNVYYHEFSGNFGNRNFYSDQLGAYLNAMYQDEFNPANQYRFGFSTVYDRYNQVYDYIGDKPQTELREEIVPGVFGEYTWAPIPDLSIVGGLRADYHNFIGLQISPRIHFRYAHDASGTVRAAVGRGWRSALTYAEQIGQMASSRNILIAPNLTNPNASSLLESGWNAGVSYTRYFRINYRPASFTVDANGTLFENMLVRDYDQSARELSIYSMENGGKSIAISGQFDYELFKRFDVRLAYKYQDVQTKYASGWNETPYVTNHRAFLNLGYKTKDKWKFDLTTNFIGSKRIPSTVMNSAANVRDTQSPNYFTVNAQINKEWNKWEAYIGIENAFNQVQTNPIIGADDPFGIEFDATMIWGPIFGRMFYFGLNYNL